MQIEIQKELINDPKMFGYLKSNSHWFKYLNRDSSNYKEFVSKMKEIYKLKPTDKINNVIENIDLVSSVLNVLK